MVVYSSALLDVVVVGAGGPKRAEGRGRREEEEEWSRGKRGLTERERVCV